MFIDADGNIICEIEEEDTSSYQLEHDAAEYNHADGCSNYFM